ncbi:hypothetical protein EGW08_010776 [Elysia chlorotica]|uniref:N-glycosylase/DNA lyase n=1 Tax=Elysia chlorotica TaxID=188477 RepID=A0A3S0ZL49_ELYCH|nr:hypothetical protein EGW08_010776 [Elysia chlorotica]
MAASVWHFIECSPTQLCLNTVLTCGQSFRWKQNGFGEWIGVMAGFVWRLKQGDNKIQYQVYTPACKTQNNKKKLKTSKLSLPKMSKLEESKQFTPLKSTVDLKPPVKQDDSTHSHSTNDVKIETNQHKKLRGLKASSDSYSTIQKAIVNQGIKVETDAYDSISDQNITNKFEENNLDSENFSKILHDYFQLDVDLDTMYQDWSKKDPYFAKVASHFRGIRMLRQDPVENLLSFVCSSNNHISRISSMVEKLCTHYGNHITTVDGEEYFDFPSLSALCGDEVETHLRQLGFGYRAKFIANIARHVVQEKGGDDWVRSLRGRAYSEAKSELMSLLGVGAKVADCVCLMSLDQPGAIPVDTHVWQITLKHYMAKLKTAKSLTDKIYNEIGEFYRDLWGPYAGWAHSVLFAADLRQNKERASLVETDVKTDSKPAEAKQVKATTKKRSSGNAELSLDAKSVKVSKASKMKSKKSLT